MEVTATISPTPPVGKTVTVQLISGDTGDTAAAGTNYTAVNQTLSFTSTGATQTVSVPLSNTNSTGDDTYFSLTGYDPVSGVGSASTILARIIPSQAGDPTQDILIGEVVGRVSGTHYQLYLERAGLTVAEAPSAQVTAWFHMEPDTITHPEDWANSTSSFGVDIALKQLGTGTGYATIQFDPSQPSDVADRPSASLIYGATIHHRDSYYTWLTESNTTDGEPDEKFGFEFKLWQNDNPAAGTPVKHFTTSYLAEATIVATEAPQLSISSSPTVTEGNTLTVQLSLQGVSFAGPAYVSVAWGDGSVSTTFITAGTASVEHIYVDDDPTNTSQDSYTIHVTGTSAAGAGFTGLYTTSVLNEAPTVQSPIVPEEIFDEAGNVTSVLIEGTILDKGVLDTETVHVVWGDALTQEATVSNRSLSITRDFGSGPSANLFPAWVTVADDDGGASAYLVDGATKSFSLEAVTKVVDVELTQNINGTKTVNGQIELDRKASLAEDASTLAITILTERQSYKITYSEDAAGNVTLISQAANGSPRRTAFQASVDAAFVLNRTNMSAYAAFVAPAPYWAAGFGEGTPQRKALEQANPSTFGPIRITSDSDIPGSTRR
jgi:hypothetical protein